MKSIKTLIQQHSSHPSEASRNAAGDAKPGLAHRPATTVPDPNLPPSPTVSTVVSDSAPAHRLAVENAAQSQQAAGDPAQAVQHPLRPATWKLDEHEMPLFATQFRPDPLNTFRALVDEYSTGTRGRPAIHDIKAFFGPSRRILLGLPSWRSAKVRGTRYIDSQICRRSRIYEKIDGGMTAKDLLTVVQENNPAFAEDETKMSNGAAV